MVTTDGGKHFNEVTIIPSDKIDGKIRCNEVPYLEDDKVKLNVYTIKDQQKAYYKFVNKGESGPFNAVAFISYIFTHFIP